jgi:hypothetical protein
VEDLASQYQIVEDAIRALGVDPVTCRRKTQGQWNLRKGSARVWVDLWYIESEKRSYFQVMSPVVPIPKDNQEKFFEELLRINDKLFGVAFTVYDGWSWLKVIREVEEMSVKEAQAIMVRVGNYADLYDDRLQLAYHVKGAKAQAASDGAMPNAPEVPGSSFLN